jgi:uncharacterized membrane protein YhhN
MKKSIWLILFAIDAITELIAIQLNNETIQLIAKPLLIPLLGAYFISQTISIKSPLKKWILIALLFSWAGDVVLMFQEKSSVYFMLGLVAFLFAHIFYIFFFHNIRVIENMKSKAWLLLIVVIYYAGLVTFLSPYLGDMKLPVRIYGIVISFMFLLAMHMLFIKNKNAGWWMMIGALLFVVSDSVLAINKFYRSFEMAGIIIMLTYVLAQFFIIEGAKRYIISAHKE